MKDPVVSVLMTTYNREKLVGEAIESVLASTFQDFELIVCDDNSSDGTVNAVKELALRDSRVKLFLHDANIGDYPNRNRAAGYAKGKYLKYVDADDYIYPWGLEILVKNMEAFPEAQWGLCSLLQCRDRPFPFVLSPQAAYEYHYFGPGLFHKAPLSSIVKKDAFFEVGGFKPLRMVGDADLWHVLAARFPVLLMVDGVVWYREHGDQEVTHAWKYRLQYEELVKRAFGDAACPLSESQKRIVFSRKRSAAIRQMAKAMLTLHWKDVGIYYKIARLYNEL